MEIRGKEICNTPQTNFKDKTVGRFMVLGESLEECFKKVYPKERRLRYLNGYFIRLDDPEINQKYREWKVKGVTIDMYYGGGTVD